MILLARTVTTVVAIAALAYGIVGIWRRSERTPGDLSAVAGFAVLAASILLGEYASLSATADRAMSGLLTVTLVVMVVLIYRYGMTVSGAKQ